MGGPSGQQDQPDPGASGDMLSTCYMLGLGWAQGIQGKEHKLCHNGTNMELGKRGTQKCKDSCSLFMRIKNGL